METIREHFELAKKVMPGGVNSSVRVNNAIGTPFYVRSAKGSRVTTIEGKEYIDMCCAHGAGLMGHAHPAIDEAVRKSIEIGYTSVFETLHHQKLAEKLCRIIPCADKIRFCSSGTEATMHMIRGCRGFTGKNKIIRIEGHFHGYHEMIYIGGQPPKEAWPQNSKSPYIESSGIPKEYADFIIPVPFNDQQAIAEAVEKHGKETAIVILEPINYNTGGIKPQKGYLEFLRKLTKENDILLFFDEIQSAFKKSPGGAQQDFGVVPDVCAIGKAIGGGFPLSAFAGRADIMDIFKPVGPVQHSGTFNATLIPVMAGLAFVDAALDPRFYEHLQRLEKQFHDGFDGMIAKHSLNMVAPHHGARFNIIFGRTTEPSRYEETFTHDKKTMLTFIRGCIEKGVYFHDYGGGCAHHGYSIAHTSEDMDIVLSVMEEVLLNMKKDGLV